MSRLFAGTSFDRPRTCDTCGKAPAECRCLQLPEKKKMSAKSKPAASTLDSGLVLTPENSRAPDGQVAKIKTEKRKGNRVVTLIVGMEHPANDLPAICTALKQKLGIGGSVQGRTIELQGENTKGALELLTARGLKARIV
jgi:translation initiation factor 1